MVEMEVDLSPLFFNDDLILDLIKQESEDESEDCVCLTNKPWTIHSCTPLINFSYAENDLKNYSLVISQWIKKECNIKSPKCTFEVVPDLAFTNKDNKSVKITAYSTENNRKKNLFEGYLVSRNSNLKSKNFIRLPVYLYTGSLKIANVVRSALESLFHASISEVRFSANELLAFSLNYCLKDGVEGDDEDFILKYGLPNNFPDNTCIDYAIHSTDYKEVFNRMLDKSREDSNIISSFYNEILLHFFNSYELNLNFFNLSIISLESHFKIARKGKIKCKNPAVLNTMLKYLTQNINRIHQI